ILYLKLCNRTDEATKTAVWEVYKFIHVNTVAPFGTFRTKIRKWKRLAL
ncbi:TPA: ClbS/DfsB family four-helix bundle protein, partial [Enterococcus faecium]